MEDVTLGQILHHIRDRLIYLFDMFGDRAYYLELMVFTSPNQTAFIHVKYSLATRCPTNTTLRKIGRRSVRMIRYSTK